MNITITPARVQGTVTAPPSKSVMQRACAAALLRNGRTQLHNCGNSNDDEAALGIIQQLGATVTRAANRKINIQSDGVVRAKAGTVLDCGESGLSFRMFTPIASLAAEPLEISVRGSLLNRPAHFFNDVLPALGVQLASAPGRFPIQVKGPLKPASITVDGSTTSQFLTGLMFAFAAAPDGEAVTIETTSLRSKPYIDITLQVMSDFKMNVPVNEDYKRFSFSESSPQPADDSLLQYTVEGDWSNGAFLLVAGAIAGQLTVKGLDVFTGQGDKKILEALQDCGCRLSIQVEQIDVMQQALKPFHFNATDCPDLFPPLAVLAASCPGTSVIEGVHRLEHKESNRAETIRTELAKMGVDIIIQDDNMIIKSAGRIHAAAVDAHGDHRIAMACAILALRADGAVTISGAEAVHKSYPDFYKDLGAICGMQPVAG